MVGAVLSGQTVDEMIPCYNVGAGACVENDLELGGVGAHGAVARAIDDAVGPRWLTQLVVVAMM